MKYENSLQVFSERIISRMKKENLVTKKGKPDVIALYNKLYPDDIITDKLIKQDRQKVTDKTRSVSDWIKGKYYPRSIKDIMDLCNILNCSMDYLFDYNECSQHDIQFIHDETGLSEDAIKELMFINKELKAYDTGRILLFILSKLIENGDFSINLMSEINNCFDKLMSYTKRKKILDELSKESGGNDRKYFQLLQTKKYKNVLSGEQNSNLKDLKDLKDLKIYHTQNHFMRILNDFLSKRVEELCKDD